MWDYRKGETFRKVTQLYNILHDIKDPDQQLSEVVAFLDDERFWKSQKIANVAFRAVRDMIGRREP